LLRGILLFFALTVVTVNLLVDLLYAKMDPRMAQGIVRETDVTGQN
jgi:ABC-type dipeptide/oligopeptide/nickel transport system permease component